MTKITGKACSQIAIRLLTLLVVLSMFVALAVQFSAAGNEAVIINAKDRVLAEGEKQNLLWGVTAKDSNGKSLLADLEVSVNGADTEKVRTFDKGEYSVTYSVDYEGKNYSKEVIFTVTANEYIDITSPVIFGAEDMRVLTGTSVKLLEDITAHDEADGDIASKVEVSINGTKDADGVYTFSAEGEYKVEYSVNDAAGNAYKTEATVTVSDEAYELARADNAVATTDSHSLSSAARVSSEASILYTGKTDNGNKVNGEATKITHVADSHAFTYFYLGETFEDYTDPTLGVGIEFYVYYPNGVPTKSLSVALSGGAERRSVRVNTAEYQTDMGGGWYKVSMPFAEFCTSESQIASAGEVNAIIFHMTCSKNSDYFVVDELTLTECMAALHAPVLTETENGIAWEAVENAGKYEIYNNGELLDTVTEAGYSLEGKPAGFYNLTVVAIPSDTGKYYNSFESNTVSCVNVVKGQKMKLEAPVITRDYHTLSWEASEYASEYKLYIDGKSAKTFDNKTESVLLSDIITDTKQHSIYLVAKGDGKTFTDSDKSNEINYANISADVETDDLSSGLIVEYGIDTVDYESFDHAGENSLHATVSTGTVSDSVKYSGIRVNFNNVSDFSEAVISVDIKNVSNAEETFSFKIRPTAEGASSSEYQIVAATNSKQGITVTKLDNGYYRYVIECGKAFANNGGCENVSFFRIGFSNMPDTSKPAVVAIDNLFIDFPKTAEKPSDNTNTPEKDNTPAQTDGDMIDLSSASLIARDAAGVAMGAITYSADGGYNNASVVRALLTEEDANNYDSINRFGMKITLSDTTFTGGNTIGVYVKTEGFDLSKYKVRLQYKSGSEYIHKDVDCKAVSDGWYYCEITVDSSVKNACNEMYVFVGEKYTSGNVSLPLTVNVSGIAIK